ncbi:MAG TPA: hypothetical protein VN712_03275 [Dermatophilaceae bacterium]|nr:hypothetical protein [Dermatophilaceae bacterium]
MPAALGPAALLHPPMDVAASAPTAKAVVTRAASLVFVLHPLLMSLPALGH